MSNSSSPTCRQVVVQACEGIARSVSRRSRSGRDGRERSRANIGGRRAVGGACGPLTEDAGTGRGLRGVVEVARADAGGRRRGVGATREEAGDHRGRARGEEARDHCRRAGGEEAGDD
ncbi:hypothetical protein FKP32DRAFT_1203862 [Trametes sanguinea]|nr:hypothetical protein FKP32DRAFT_1203862 [Trametes sanguinea]